MRWIFVFLVLIGDLLIVKKNRIGFYLWIVVDGFFSFSNILEGDFVEASIFGIYAVMGFYGLYLWKPGG
jgi:hypothetical protein